jgi:hypothetical protein
MSETSNKAISIDETDREAERQALLEEEKLADFEVGEITNGIPPYPNNKFYKGEHSSLPNMRDPILQFSAVRPASVDDIRLSDESHRPTISPRSLNNSTGSSGGKKRRTKRRTKRRRTNKRKTKRINRRK